MGRRKASTVGELVARGSKLGRAVERALRAEMARNASAGGSSSADGNRASSADGAAVLSHESSAAIISADDMLSLIPGYDPRIQGSGFRFDYDRASGAVRWIHEHVELVTGRKPGTPFILLPWQQAVVGNLFGWVRDDGTRRYREAFVYVAKKNGKTELTAAILCMILCTEGDEGIQCYSAAASHAQATVIFIPAAAMIRRSEYMSSRIRVYGDSPGAMNKALVYEDNPLSVFRCLAHDAGTADGIGPHLNLIDEVHRFDDSALIDVMLKGTAARRQPLTIYTSTADYDRPSPCNELLRRARAVAANRGTPDEPGYEPYFLPVLYECGQDDDWSSPDTWRKANPSLGATLTEEFLRRECERAKSQPGALMSFLRFHLNIVTTTETAWLPMDQWDRCGTIAFGDDDFLGESCWGGLDLSSTEDITAFVLLFPRDDIFYVLARFFCPERRIQERSRQDGAPYAVWAKEGYLTPTPGEVVDQDCVRRAILSAASKYNIVEIVYDRWNSAKLVTELERDGLTMVQFAQNLRAMSGPSKEFESLVRAGRLAHGGNPVLRWMAGNAMIRVDENENYKPLKDRNRRAKRIDGIIAAIMALSRASVADLSSSDDNRIAWVL